MSASGSVFSLGEAIDAVEQAAQREAVDVAVVEAVKARPQSLLMQSPLPGMRWSLMPSHRASLSGLRCSLRFDAGQRI